MRGLSPMLLPPYYGALYYPLKSIFFYFLTEVPS